MMKPVNGGMVFAVSLSVVFLLLPGSSDAGVRKYPTTDANRVAHIRKMFHYYVVEHARKSADSIIDLVKVSTSLEKIREDLKTNMSAYSQTMNEASKYSKEVVQCEQDLKNSINDCLPCVQNSCEDYLEIHKYFEDCQIPYEDFLNQQSELLSSAADLQVSRITANFKEIESDKAYIDQIHKIVNGVASSLINILAKLSPEENKNDQMKEHLAEKLKMTSAEITAIFNSLKFLSSPEKRGSRLPAVYDDNEVLMATKNIDKLLQSMNEGKSVALDARELLPLVKVPAKKGKDDSILDKLLDGMGKVWDKTKDVGEVIWGTSKSAVKKTACAIKGVFSDGCDDNKRRRRSASQTTCGMRFNGMKLDSCYNNAECTPCSAIKFPIESSICKKTEESYEKIREKFEIAYSQATEKESDFKKSKSKAEEKRIELLEHVKKTLEENLYIISLDELLKNGAFEKFKDQSLWFDPNNFFQKNGRIFYRDVEMQLEVNDISLKLEPLDVHNATLVAKFSADSFVSHFKDAESVRKVTEDIMKSMKP